MASYLLKYCKKYAIVNLITYLSARVSFSVAWTSNHCRPLTCDPALFVMWQVHLVYTQQKQNNKKFVTIYLNYASSESSHYAILLLIM